MTATTSAQADARALSSSLWGLQELDAFPGEPAQRALEAEFAARLAGGRVPRRPVVIFVNSLAHFVRAAGWRPSEELLAQAEAWVVALAAAAGGALAHGADEVWEARSSRFCGQWHSRRRGLPPLMLVCAWCSPAWCAQVLGSRRGSQ